MKSIKRKIARFRKKAISWVGKRNQSRNPATTAGRIRYLESSLDSLSQDFHALKAEFQIASVRQQALVDYYETRIDRIYARLSSQTALANGMTIQIAQDSSEDDVILEGFQKAIQTRSGYTDVPVLSVLSDRIEPGMVRGPLTLQGYKIRRGMAQEQGDAIYVRPLENGNQSTVLFGPYKKLLPGRYSVTLLIEPGAKQGNTVLRAGFDVYCPSIDKVCAEASVTATADADGLVRTKASFDWSIEDADREVEFRVLQKSLISFKIIGFDIERV